MPRLLVLDVKGVFGDGQGLAAFSRSLYAGCGPERLAWDYGAAARLAHEVVSRLDDTGVRDDALRIGIAAVSGEQAGEVAQFIGDALPGGPRAFHQRDLPEGLATCAEWLGGDIADLALLVLGDEQCVAVLTLALLDRASARCGYASIDVTAGVERPTGEGLGAVLAQVNLSPSDIGYLEVASWPPDSALAETFRQGGEGLTCAVGSLAGTMERCAGSASFPWVTALLKVLMSMQQRVLYPSPGSLPGDELWDGTSLYVVPEARPWFRQRPERPRRALYLYPLASGGMYCVVFSELGPDRPAVLLVPRVQEQDCVLLPVVGETVADLVTGIQDVHRRLSDGETAASLMEHTIAVYQARQRMPLAVVLVGHNGSELAQETVRALKGVERSFASGRDWVTPRGSAFSPRPLGGRGVTMVYPGAFNAYVGLGRDLFQYFPFLHEVVGEVLSDLRRVTAADYIYPRAHTMLSDEMVQQLRRALARDPVALIESGTAFALAYTEILRRVFHVRVAYALGYSLGETSMLWSLRVWQGGDRASEVLRSLPLFRSDLAGPRLAVRKAWGLDAEAPLEWVTCLLKAPLRDVEAVVATEPRVYITLVNLVDEVVIAGDAKGCRRVIKSLGCHALPVPFDTVIHNEVVRTEYDQLLTLYDHAIRERPGITFFSAAHYAPLVLERDALAHAMAEMSCQMIDFPRLVERAYAEGARVFVEVGPQATSTRRITRILKEKPHVAVGMDPTGADDLQGVLSTVARLIAHRVPVDLSALRSKDDKPGPITVVLKPRVERESSDLSQSELYEDVKVPPRGEKWQARPRAEEAIAVPGLSLAEIDAQLGAHERRLAQLQREFLAASGEFQESMGRLIQLQCQMAVSQVGGRPEAGALSRSLDNSVAVRPRFDAAAVEAFAKGDPVDCFGERYEAYRGHRLPRIPNGDLLLMSRVLDVTGEPGIFDGTGRLRSAYEVPIGAWYYNGAYRSLPPYFTLMEMGMQPCGFLSAYLGSAFLSSERDLYFRNLDGRGRVLAELDLRGKTVECECHLQSTTRSRDVILQSFEFALYAMGQCFFEGWASFGYFPRRMLREQQGLSYERASAKGDGISRFNRSMPIPAALDPKPAAVRLLRDLRVVDVNGEQFVVGVGRLSPEDWFFKAHFYEDPVMPGSLGLEGMAQALRAYGRWRYPEFAGAAVGLPREVTTEWKYRGQITPADSEWELQVKVSSCRQEDSSLLLIGDGTFWKGDMCIYEVHGLAVRLDH